MLVALQQTPPAYPSTSTPNSLSVFPIHATAIGTGTVDVAGETIGVGDTQIHIRINDPDFDISATGEDVIASDIAGDVVGPLKITMENNLWTL